MEQPPGPLVGRGPLGEGVVPGVMEAPVVGASLRPAPAAVAVPVEGGVEAGAPWQAATKPASTATAATTGRRLVIRRGSYGHAPRRVRQGLTGACPRRVRGPRADQPPTASRMCSQLSSRNWRSRRTATTSIRQVWSPRPEAWR